MTMLGLLLVLATLNTTFLTFIVVCKWLRFKPFQISKIGGFVVDPSSGPKQLKPTTLIDGNTKYSQLVTDGDDWYIIQGGKRCEFDLWVDAMRDGDRWYGVDFDIYRLSGGPSSIEFRDWREA